MLLFFQKYGELFFYIFFKKTIILSLKSSLYWDKFFNMKFSVKKVGGVSEVVLFATSLMKHILSFWRL